VPAYLKAGLGGEAFLQLPEAAIGKIYHPAAVGTYQVVVVLGGAAH
jgi:hypothetical protein